MAWVFNRNNGEYDQWEDDFDPYEPPPQPDPPVQLGSFGVPENGGNKAGYMDLSYYQSRHDQGLPGAPSYEDMVDENGQLRPGWARTAKGYEYLGTPLAQTPAGPSGPAPDPWGGGGGSYMPPQRRTLASLNMPAFNAPRFEAPAPFSFDPFSFESFTAPTLQEAQNEPGFDYALQQGLKAMENSKAYLGTYRTGGTIKGLNDYARNMANQNYNEVFRRKGETYDRNRGNAFGNWSANRENAADAYATNYGISRDVFDRNYTAAKDEYQPRAREAELNFARDWDMFTYEGDDDYRRWKAMIDANS